MKLLTYIINRNILLYGLLFLVMPISGQSNGTIDTLYYDSEWNIAPSKEFATYKRIVFTSNDVKTYKNMYRDYNINENWLCGEGQFITLDYSNVKNNVYDGICKKYYKNGNLKERCIYKNGVSNGEFVFFYENGYVEKQCTYKNGKLDGIVNEFSKDGTVCTQILTRDGEPALDYYTVSNINGLCSKYKIKTRDPYFEKAESSEMQEIDEEGFFTTEKNGVIIRLCLGKWQYYGTYLQLRFNISNLTLDPISFNPNNIVVEYIKKDKTKKVTPMTADEYAGIIRSKQQVLMGLYSFASALNNAYNAYNTTTNTSSISYFGNTNYEGNSYSNNSSVYYGGASNYNGNINVTTTTRTYDPYIAYQAQIITENKMQSYRYAFKQQVDYVYDGYLQPTKIQSAETVTGHVNASYFNIKKYDILRITVYINNTPYVFEWDKSYFAS